MSRRACEPWVGEGGEWRRSLGKEKEARHGPARARCVAPRPRVLRADADKKSQEDARGSGCARGRDHPGAMSVLPPGDPLLDRIACGSRVQVQATESWSWLNSWDRDASISLRDGAQAVVVINETVEKLESGRALTEHDKIYLDICPHSTPGHFHVSREERANGTFRIAATPGAPCAWCGCSSGCGVAAVARANQLPDGVKLCISSLLSLHPAFSPDEDEDAQ